MVRASVPDLRQLVDVAAKVVICADSLRGLGHSSASTAAVRNALQTMEKLSDVLSAERVGLPNLDSFDASMLDSAGLLEELRALVGDTLDDLVADEVMPPSALVELRDLLRQSDALGTLPSWILTGESGEAPIVSAPSLNYIALRLKNIERRHLVKNYLGYLEQLSEPRAARWLREPDANQDPAEHVKSWFEGARDHWRI